LEAIRDPERLRGVFGWGVLGRWIVRNSRTSWV